MEKEETLKKDKSANVAPLQTGIYTGRLRNNSGRQECSARDKEQLDSKITTPKKNLKAKIKKGKSAIEASSPDIRQYINIEGSQSQIPPDAIGTHQQSVSNPEQGHQSESTVPSNLQIPAVITHPTVTEQTANVTANNAPGYTINKAISEAVSVILEAEMELQTAPQLNQDRQQIQTDEKAIMELEKKLQTIKDETMEKMLLEMQLDTKKESLKMRRMFLNSLAENQKSG